MSERVTVGPDLANDVFQVHGADSAGRAVLRNKRRRGQVLEIFGTLPPCPVAMDVRGGAHFRGRAIGTPGHELRWIAPAHVKPFVTRPKHDAPEARAICAAPLRPTMRCVPVKSAETLDHGHGVACARGADPAVGAGEH